MKRGSRLPEVVGMPFLDLICCAFGGIILLYLLAERSDGSPSPVTNGMRVYIAELPGGSSHRLGMRLKSSGIEASCWPPHNCESGAVLWKSDPGMLLGMVKATDAVDCITVAMTQPESRYSLPANVLVKISSPGGKLDTSVELKPSSGYRITIPDPEGSGSC